MRSRIFFFGKEAPDLSIRACPSRQESSHPPIPTYAGPLAKSLTSTSPTPFSTVDNRIFVLLTPPIHRTPKCLTGRASKFLSIHSPDLLPNRPRTTRTSTRTTANSSQQVRGSSPRFVGLPPAQACCQASRKSQDSYSLSFSWFCCASEVLGIFLDFPKILPHDDLKANIIVSLQLPQGRCSQIMPSHSYYGI